MRKSILILLLLWSFFCYTQNDMYCIYDTSGAYQLSTINTTTGVVTNIAPFFGPSFYVLGNKNCISTHDSTYIFSGHDGTNARLYTLDLATGTVLNNPIFGNVVVGLKYNCEDSTIYAIEEVTGNYYLVTVDKVTGLTTQLGIVGGVTAYVGDGFALDTKRGLYHLLGLFSSNIHIYSVDIKTGLVTASPAFPDNVIGLEYNCNDSTIYGLWEDGLDYKLERVIPSSGIHSTIGTLNNINTGYVGESTSINKNGEYTYRGFSSTNAATLITIDVQTATIIDTIGFANSGVAGMTYFACCSDSISTVGIVEAEENNEGLIYPNPFHDKAHVQWNKNIQNGTIEIYDIFGKLIFTEDKISGLSYELKRNNMGAGIYIVELKSENKIRWKGKLIAD